MDKSVKNKNPKKMDIKYSWKSFFLSFSSSISGAIIIFTVTTLMSSYMYYNIWELTSMKDTVKEFYAYWDAPVNTTYKIRHKLQKGEQLWFFMKDIKTGKEFDDCSVNPKIFVSKNEGDVITYTQKRYEKYKAEWGKVDSPVRDKFSWPWWWLLWYPFITFIIYSFMNAGPDSVFSTCDSRELNKRLGREETKLEYIINRPLKHLWVSFVWLGPITSLVLAVEFFLNVR